MRRAIKGGVVPIKSHVVVAETTPICIGPFVVCNLDRRTYDTSQAHSERPRKLRREQHPDLVQGVLRC